MCVCVCAGVSVCVCLCVCVCVCVCAGVSDECMPGRQKRTARRTDGDDTLTCDTNASTSHAVPS